MSQQTTQIEDVPKRVYEALIDEFGDSQDRRMRGYVPSQSIQKLMGYLEPHQVQRVKAVRRVKDKSESFGMVGYDLPNYVEAEEQLKRELILDYDRAKHKEFDWERLQEFLVESELKDIAVRKLVVRMENEQLRDHLFKLLQSGLNYPSSYKSEFTDPFYFVMKSKPAELDKDYRKIKDEHEDGYLKELGWQQRCLDLMGIWSHKAWTKSGCSPMADESGKVTQRDIEELAFNRLEDDEPVFGAVNSPLVINRWRTPFGRGTTDMRHFEWQEQNGWVRVD
jgi:hypothetical protein